MKATCFIWCAVALAAVGGSVQAVGDQALREKVFEASPQPSTVLPSFGTVMSGMVRKASSTSQASFKSSFRTNKDDAASRTSGETTDSKKKVRFFVHEDGDLNILDTQGNDYVSTDDDEEAKQSHDGVSSSPHRYLFKRSHEHERWAEKPLASTHYYPAPSDRSIRSVSSDAEHHLSETTARVRRHGMELSERKMPSSMMDYKRHVASRIRTVESKIEYLADLIAAQKQQRAEAAKYNLARLKLGDYQEHKRFWSARIRLLKDELQRQESELAYYESEMVIVQQRLHAALHRLQRLPHATTL